jgi:hypothetical protein
MLRLSIRLPPRIADKAKKRYHLLSEEAACLDGNNVLN